ncbi:unnamed protein product, partial [Urochloa humidicola]
PFLPLRRSSAPNLRRLGTGFMAAHALDRLGDLLRVGALPGVAGVPTPLKMELHASCAGIPLLPLDAASGARI